MYRGWQPAAHQKVYAGAGEASVVRLQLEYPRARRLVVRELQDVRDCVSPKTVVTPSNSISGEHKASARARASSISSPISVSIKIWCLLKLDWLAPVCDLDDTWLIVNISLFMLQ
jgi:hypothetical protein